MSFKNCAQYPQIFYGRNKFIILENHEKSWDQQLNEKIFYEIL